MIRLATAADLPAVAAVYDAILDREAESGVCYTNWQKGKYPTMTTAKSILEAGTLYVGTDADGTVWGSMNLNGLQLPEYGKINWSIPAPDSQVAVIHTLTIHPDRKGRGLARQMVRFAEDTARARPPCGWTPGRAMSPPTTSIPPWATVSRAPRTSFSWAIPTPF